MKKQIAALVLAAAAFNAASAFAVDAASAEDFVATAAERECLEAVNIPSSSMYYDSKSDRYASLAGALNLNVMYRLGYDNRELKQQSANASVRLTDGVLSLFLRRFCTDAAGVKSDCSIREKLPLTHELLAKFIWGEVGDLSVQSRQAKVLESLGRDALANVINSCAGLNEKIDDELLQIARQL